MRIQLFTQEVTSQTAASSSQHSFTYNPNHMHCFGYCDSCESEFYGSFGKRRKVDRENFLKFYNFTKCPVCGAPFKRKKGYFAMDGSEISEWIRLSTWPIIEKEQAYKFDPVNLQQSTYLTRQELELRTGVREGKITLDELLTVLPGIEEDEIPCYVNEYLININGIFKLLRWRRPSTLHLAQKKASSFLESCSAQAVGEVAKNINIEKTPAFLQEYFLHLINLDTEIHSASQYLSHLYLQQHSFLRRIRDEKYQLEHEQEQQLEQLTKQARAAERELETLLSRPSTANVSEIEIGKPSKPVEPCQPTLKTPGLFNKKAVLKYNEDLKSQYEQEMQRYRIAFECYTAALETYEETRQKAYERAQQQAQTEIDAAKAHLENIQAQIFALTSQQASSVQANTPLLTLKEALDKEIADFESLIKKLFDARATLYSYNIVYGKYRDVVAVSSFYEYFLSGRCDSLEGSSGAYNLYETECRANIIISRLDQVVDSLEKIKNTQFMIYNQMQTANRQLESMQSSLQCAIKELTNISDAVGTISDNTSMIAHTSVVTAYYSKVNAQMTNALGFMMALS